MNRHSHGLVRRRSILALSSFAAPFLVAAVALRAMTANATGRPLRIGGSGGAMTVLRRLAEAYRDGGADIEIATLPPLGSDGGIAALLADRLDVAASARSATQAEYSAGVRRDETALAMTPLPFVVHSAVPVRGITLAEAVRIYRGEIGAWPDGTRIRIIRRPSGNGDFRALCDLSPAMAAALNVAERRRGLFTAANGQENAEALETVAGAFGTMTLGQIMVERRRVRALELDGVPAVLDSMGGTTYPAYKPLHLLLRAEPSAAALGLLEFARGPQGSELLRAMGHAPAIAGMRRP